MDTQAKIDADYAMGRPDQGFFSDIGGNKKKTYETTTAKSMAEGLGLDYTGQSLAEIMVIADAQSQTGDTTPVTTTDVGNIDYSDVTPEAVARVANDFKSNVGNMSMDQQLKALNLMTEGRSGTVIGEDGEVVNVNPDNIYGDPGVNRTAISALRADIQRSVTPDVFAKMEEGVDAEAAGFDSGLPDEQENRRQAMADARAKFERDQQQDADDAATGRGNIVTDSRGRPVTDSSGRPVTTRQGSAARSTPEGDDEINRQAEAMRRDADRREREETSRKNEEKMQQKIASGVDLEAAAYESGLPDDDNSGGKSIVCTEMYRQTQLDDWARTMKIWDTYQKKYLTPLHEVGYHWLFKPYVRGMQNSGILTNVGAFFAQKRTQHLRHILTKGRAKDSFVGNVWCKIIHPIVYLVGKMVYKK